MPILIQVNTSDELQKGGVPVGDAIPLIEETSELQISAGTEVGMAVVFRAIPSATHLQWSIGLRRDLSI